MSKALYSEIKEACNSNKAFALCTVIETDGSSPGKTGQKMMVFRDGSIKGTIGGGVNEERARKEALDLFVTQETQILNFDMSGNTSLTEGEPVCGGKSKVLIELYSPEPQMIIFGAGHIGKKLAQMAALTGFKVTITDERPAYADPSLFSKETRVICDTYENAVKAANIDDKSTVIVCTPGHVKDRETVEYVLPYKPGYLGLVGSGKKSAAFRAYLKGKNFDPKQVEDIFTPIGISLGSTTPEEIVIEILAQIVAFRNGREIRYSRI